MIRTYIGYLAVGKQMESFLLQVVVQLQPGENLVFRQVRPIFKFGIVYKVIRPAGGQGRQVTILQPMVYRDVDKLDIAVDR